MRRIAVPRAAAPPDSPQVAIRKRSVRKSLHADRTIRRSSRGAGTQAAWGDSAHDRRQIEASSRGGASCTLVTGCGHRALGVATVRFLDRWRHSAFSIKLVECWAPGVPRWRRPGWPRPARHVRPRRLPAAGPRVRESLGDGPAAAFDSFRAGQARAVPSIVGPRESTHREAERQSDPQPKTVPRWRIGRSITAARGNWPNFRQSTAQVLRSLWNAKLSLKLGRSRIPNGLPGPTRCRRSNTSSS